ncbi:MAG TPA: ferritin-like domain-containing protein [Gemmatimonadaceae bacterium]|nr:ferritin-like domain-containing protein [Gemmatimonadaceae bacterium]
MADESLQDIYVEQLKDLYSAENQILKALPKMAKGAASKELSSSFQEHEVQTRTHVERLEKIFSQLGEKPGGHKCKGMEGLLEEGDEVLEEHDESPARDAAMIAAAQRVEHYEIAGYGTVRTMANMLGFADQATLLQQTLDEEGLTDKKLTTLAETVVNVQAVSE